MKSIFSIFFIIAIGFQSINSFITLLHWKINQKEITDKFCENKAKPILKCNGKCHLMKQLKAQEELEQKELSKSKNQSTPKLNKTEEWFGRTANICFIIESSKDLSHHKPALKKPSVYSLEITNKLFQPPQIS